jgi:peptide/nickel transport system ATP-binding protein
MNTPILRTEKLKAYYVLDLHGTQKVVKAVNEVDIEIQENEVYGIAGESGCGKTTLLKTLVAAIEPPLRLVGGKVYYRVIDFEGIEIAAIGPLSPSDAEEDRWWTGGEVDVSSLTGRVAGAGGAACGWTGGEVDVSSLTPETKRRLRWEYISYVPQGSMSVLNPVTKVKETYRDFIGSHTSGQIAKEEAFKLAKEQITELGLPPKILDAYPHQLSGGMRQRVTIALAALLKPRIIVCDEPTTALDVVVQRGVVQLLKDVQAKLKNTIIVVTHDMGIQANIADRVGIMYAGKIVEESTTETIFGNPAHPYTRYLIDSLPRFGDKTTRESVPGSPPSLADLPSGCPFHPRCPYALDICVQQMPGFTRLEPNHRVACWLVGEGKDGKTS